MGPLQPVVKAPLDPEVGCPCCFSEEEDAAERALRFHVRTQKQQLQHEEGGGSRRLQQVVDKPVVWGPKVMPLASILGATQQADSSENHKDKRHRTDIQGARDSFEVKCILSTDECQRLVEAAEAQGFEYWAKETASAPGRTFAQNDNEYHRSIGGHRSSSSSTSSRSVGSSESQRANHNYRSAHTVEVEHPDLADLIWQRVKEYVIREVSFSEEDGERFERDLEGTWEACGVNSTLLFARYTEGENFGPHTDGCTVKDFNCRSLWPMVIYLNTPSSGGETTILSDLQKELPFKTDSAGRFVSDPQCVVFNCKAEVGNALLFYHTQMHEGRPVGKGAVKYIIRTDIMYRRKEPLFTSPADQKAFALWQTAQLLAEEGETDSAAQLFRQMTKVSPDLAYYYGM